jgi:hypothetical protein
MKNVRFTTSAQQVHNNPSHEGVQGRSQTF